MSFHLNCTPEERTILLKDMWNKPLMQCNSRDRLCPFALMQQEGTDKFPVYLHCILSKCEPNRRARTPHKVHKTSFRPKRKKKLYPLLGVYHTTFRRKKIKGTPVVKCETISHEL